MHLILTNAEFEQDGNFGSYDTIEHHHLVRKTDANLGRKVFPLEHVRQLLGIHPKGSMS